MQRREFLATSAAAALALVAGQPAPASAADDAAGRALIELRIYRFASAEKREAFEKFMAAAAIPAFNRLGITPVGVFKLLKDDNRDLKLQADSTDLYVLMQHKSAATLLTLERQLAADEAFQKAGAGILDAPKSNPAFQRCESTLLLGFDKCPQVQAVAKGDARILQLRIYESHNAERALKKMAMFNEGGEIDVFRRCGMNPVFFGQALAGPRLPHLAYMLSFENAEAQGKAWGAFGKDPDWIRLRDAAEYKDTVSSITNLILRPAAGSQI